MPNQFKWQESIIEGGGWEVCLSIYVCFVIYVVFVIHWSVNIGGDTPDKQTTDIEIVVFVDDHYLLSIECVMSSFKDLIRDECNYYAIW